MKESKAAASAASKGRGTSAGAEATTKASTLARFGALAVAVVAVVLLVRALPTREWLEDFQEWVRAKGPIGWAFFVAGYALAVVCFFPASVLTLGAGAIFGPWIGIVLVSAGATIGACLAFGAARTFLRSRVSRLLESKPKLKAVDRAIAARGGWIVFLLRLTPVLPFVALNYALGVTGVSFGAYAVASWIGMFPGTIAYVLLGHAGKEALSGGQNLAFAVVAAVVTLALTIVLTKVASRAVRDAGIESDAKPTS